MLIKQLYLVAMVTWKLKYSEKKSFFPYAIVFSGAGYLITSSWNQAPLKWCHLKTEYQTSLEQ